MADNGQISVSKDFLARSLLELKLDLIRELATKGEVERLDGRLGSLESRMAVVERRDSDEDAVDRNRGRLFSTRAQAWGIAVATCAVILQALIVTGVIR